MSFVKENQDEMSFLERVAPFFYENVYDSVQFDKDAQNFKKLAAAYEISPGIEKQVSQDCVELFLDNNCTIKFDSKDIFYYMFKYHSQHMLQYDGRRLFNYFDPKETKLIEEVFDSYEDVVPCMMDMADVETDFLYNKKFNPEKHDPKLMDMYRVETVANISTTMDCFSSTMNEAKCIKALSHISQLGQSHTPFIQKEMDHIRDQLLDSLCAYTPVRHPRPFGP